MIHRKVSVASHKVRGNVVSLVLVTSEGRRTPLNLEFTLDQWALLQSLNDNRAVDVDCYVDEDLLDLLLREPMSTENFWKEMWRRKGSGEEMFAHAILQVDRPASWWNGNHPVEKNSVEYIIPAGTKVLITACSRFGRVCFRDYDIDRRRHGYVSSAEPKDLSDLRFL